MKEKDEPIINSKDQNLIKLEGIKTMTWHSKTLIDAFDDLGYDNAYKSQPASFFSEVEHSDFKTAKEKMGADLYKTFGLPDDKKVLEGQRKKFGRNELTEVDQNPW